MYRAVALALTRADIPFSDAGRVVEFLNHTRLEMPAGQILLNGEDVTEAIRHPSMSDASSRVAVEPHVRAVLVQWQRQVANGRNMVCEGRDQGSVVFADSPCKFFLTASVPTRAARRLARAAGPRGRRPRWSESSKTWRSATTATGPASVGPLMMPRRRHRDRDGRADPGPGARPAGGGGAAMPPWLADRWWDLGKVACFYTMTGLFSLRTAGGQHVPRSGPVLVLSNHQTFLDPVLVGLAIPRYVRWVARQTLHKNRLLAAADRQPAGDPDRPPRVLPRRACKRRSTRLDSGALRRHVPGGRADLRRATSSRSSRASRCLIKRTKAPIIPAGIAGAYAAFSRHRKFPRLLPAVPAADRRDHCGLGRQADRPGEVREDVAGGDARRPAAGGAGGDDEAERLRRKRRR